MDGLRVRPAVFADAPVIQRLIAASARALSRGDYSEAQVEAALGTTFGLDAQLVADGTYFVAEAKGEIVGCGGWSRRRALFGANARVDAAAEALDPARDAARIRAFFVRPDWARRGVARALLAACEEAAGQHGFRTVELVATLPGHRFYRSAGYVGDERRTYPLRDGITIEFIPMKKDLSGCGD